MKPYAPEDVIVSVIRTQNLMGYETTTEVFDANTGYSSALPPEAIADYTTLDSYTFDSSLVQLDKLPFSIRYLLNKYSPDYIVVVKLKSILVISAVKA